MAAITTPTPIFLSNKLKSAGRIVASQVGRSPRAHATKDSVGFNEMDLEIR
jgi:hypothetical protein